MSGTEGINIGERVSTLLAEAGLRITDKRKKILETLITVNKPVSHSDLLDCGELRGMDRVTVYRNLSILEEKGIIHSAIGEDGVRHFRAHLYDKPGCPGDHPHFICLSCKDMICLTEQRLPHIDVPEGYTVTGKRFLVYGFCRKCREKDKQ